MTRIRPYVVLAVVVFSLASSRGALAQAVGHPDALKLGPSELQEPATAQLTGVGETDGPPRTGADTREPTSASLAPDGVRNPAVAPSESRLLSDRVVPQPKDANRTRLLIGPTARALNPGEVYLDFSGFVGGPFVQAGLTDRVSIGAGTPVLIPGIELGQFFVLTPKVQVFRGMRTSAAVGAMHATARGEGSAGLGYVVVTRGTTDAAVTAGVGVSYASIDLGSNGTPVLLLGGEKRVTSAYKAIAEGQLTRNGGLVSAGMRFGRRHKFFDLGLATTLGAGH